MNRKVFFGLIILLLAGCTNNDPSEEASDFFKKEPVEDSYKVIMKEEQMPVSTALENLSFVPKQLNEESLPFQVKKKGARVTRKEEGPELIQLGYGGLDYQIDLLVENEMIMKREPSVNYEEVILENGRSAFYAEDEENQHITWMEKDMTYLLIVTYKMGTGSTPEEISKEEIIKLANELK